MKNQLNKKEKRLQDRFLVEDVFTRMFVTMLLGMITSILCNLIDSVVTGQFLGSNAIAAMGLITPMVSLVGLVTSLFVSGTSQMCTRNMGKADLNKVNQIFSTMAVCSVGLCLLSCVLLFVFAPVYVAAVAKNVDEEVVRMAIEYLRGYSLILPPMGVCTLLNGLMVLDNDQKRSMGFALMMLFLDVIFDLVNVLVLHWGMLGMALASSLSCFLSMFYLLLHFKKPGRLLKFVPRDLFFGDVKEVLTYGVAGAIPMLMNSVRSACFNSVLLRTGGVDAVAAFSVAGIAFMLIVSIISSVQSTTTTVCSLCYGEEDLTGLERTLKKSFGLSYRVYLVFGLILFVFAGFITRIFLRNPSVEANQMAVTLIRFMAVSNLLTIASYTISGSFTGTGHVKLNYVFSTLRDGLYPCLCVLILGLAFGMPGIYASLLTAGALTLLTCFLIPGILNHKWPVSLRDLLILPESFRLGLNEFFQASVRTMEEAMLASQKAYDFCVGRGEDAKTAGFVSLFIEEMAGNTILHGFGKTRNGRVEVKLILKDGKRMIRLKDNGIPFDPVKWLRQNHPEDPEANIGIRMIVGLARRIYYVPAMGINNLIVYLT